ncbi:MAG: PHP domain-containing protein [Desulfobacterales bacterium]|nr:PHP domain-containing protein [Desulfobacterales bacterium]
MDYKKKAGIDLHIHSNASDGTFSPAEILSLAQKLQLRAISITDHDSIDGAREALELGIPDSLEFLTGVEISAAPPFEGCTGSFHILGYGVRLDAPVLNHTLEVQQAARDNRNPMIIERLHDLGIHLSLEEIRAETGDGQVGRPHIARRMVQQGIVDSIDEAFDLHLGAGKPAYVDKARVECRRAIDIVRDAGGIAVLAHPILLTTPPGKSLEDLIIQLKDMGLQGLEVFYPEHPPEAAARFKSFAEKYDLLMTGGTDFHGAIKPEIMMGSGTGDLHVPHHLYETIISALEKGRTSD